MILAAVAAVFVGCGTYSKILKSEDPEVIYKAAMDYYEQGKYNRTVDLFGMVRHLYLNTERADSIAYFTGMAYYKNRSFDMSSMTFDDFRKRYGRSPFLPDAEYRYAKGLYYMSPASNRDQTATVSALVAINEYLERYPDNQYKEILVENMRELNGKLDDKAFINAKLYYTTKNYKSAVVAFRNALSQFPESKHKEEMMYLTVRSAFLLAQNSVYSLKRDRYLDMMDSYYTFVSDYPESSYRKNADGMMEAARAYMALTPEEAENKETL